MKRRHINLIVVEGIIIVILLIVVATLFILLNKSSQTPSLPRMPTYDFPVSTRAPLSVIPPNLNTEALPSEFTQTEFPLLPLGETPIYITPLNNTPMHASSPTLTPVAVMVWSYTPTPPITTPQTQPCKNILYPVGAGKQWSYRANALDRTVDLNIDVLSINNSQGNVLVNIPSTGKSKEVQIRCEGDVILSCPFISVDMLFGESLNSSMNASYVSGVLAPNEAAFLNTNWALAWSSQYLVSGNTTINHNGTQINIAFNNSPITLACQTLASGDAAFETVTVAAGTFRALKVACTEQGQVTAVLNGISVAGLLKGQSYQWFAPDIGLVKMQVDQASVTIFDLSFSLLTNNYLELKSAALKP
jgi:hypothetical protein